MQISSETLWETDLTFKTITYIQGILYLHFSYVLISICFERKTWLLLMISCTEYCFSFSNYLFFTTFSIYDTYKGWCFPGEIPHLMWLIITGTEWIHSGRMEMITIFNQSGKVRKPFHLWNLQFYHMSRRVCNQIKWDTHFTCLWS